MAGSLAETIVDLEHQTWKALQNKGEDLLPFLAPDCIMLFPLGMKISSTSAPTIKDVMTSEAFVPWARYHMSEVDVTPIGSDGAVICYRVKAVKPNAHGKDDTFRALISSVWRKGPASGHWQMCHHQQTPFEQEIEDLA